MHSTLYLFIVFILLGIVIYLLNKYTRTSKKNSSIPKRDVVNKASNSVIERPDGCCGAHEVCEKDSLITTKTNVEYFEDEELDLYRGRTSDSYTGKEIEEFEDVLLTLKENEVAEWLKSTQLRGIELPETIKSQALMIISERRGVE